MLVKVMTYDLIGLSKVLQPIEIVSYIGVYTLIEISFERFHVLNSTNYYWEVIEDLTEI